MKRLTAALAVGSLIVLGAAPVLAHLHPWSRYASNYVRTSTRNHSLPRTYGSLPLSFEANVGQTDPRVKFVSRAPGAALFLTSDGAVMSLRAGSSVSSPGRRSALALFGRPSRTDVVSMRFRGANPGASIEGVSRLPGTSSSFVGNDPSAWRTGIPTYGGVRYRSIYPGVDLTYYGNQAGTLEYDLTFAAGADLSVVRLAFQGQRNVSLDAHGGLILRLRGGDVRQLAPFAYQLVDGVRHSVPVSYVVRGATVTFEVGQRDASIPLVIDPVIAYSTYIGGTAYEEIDAIAVDRHRNAYLFGPTASADFPIEHCTLECTFKGGNESNSDDFVAKLDPTGTSLLWSTYLGGSDTDEAFGMTLDRAGNAYVSGPTLSLDFPTTPGAFQETAPGGDHDGFVAKIDPSGSRLVFSTYLGGSGHDATLTPAVNAAGDVYVVGDTNSADLPVTDGAFQSQTHGGDCTIFKEFDDDCDEGGGVDMFVAELNPTGSGLLYLTYLGGTGDDVGVGLAVDRSGNAYVSMETTSTDYPVTDGAYQTTFAGGDGTDGVYSDSAVTKLNQTGSALVYSTYLGGTGDDCFFFQCFVDVDAQDHAFVASNSDSTDFPTTEGAFQTTNRGGFDDTVTKLSSDGRRLVYSTYLGGSADDSTVNVRTIVVRANGEAYVSGYTSSPDFPTVNPVQGSFSGVADATLSVLNKKGSALRFSTYLGGSDFEAADLNLDSSGAAYLAGVTCSTDYPVTDGAYQGSLAGDCDGMVAKIVISHEGPVGVVHRGATAARTHPHVVWRGFLHTA